jgi:hypothetical protein
VALGTACVVSGDDQRLPETVRQAIIQMCRITLQWAAVLRDRVLCSDPAERIVSDRNVAGSEVLDIMTIHFYSLMIGLGLAILTAIGCTAMLLGWFLYLGSKLRHSRKVDERVHDVHLTGPQAWGEPDLTPPSTSATARAEVADLEALWTLPPHRASTGTD